MSTLNYREGNGGAKSNVGGALAHSYPSVAPPFIN